MSRCKSTGFLKSIVDREFAPHLIESTSGVDKIRPNPVPNDRRICLYNNNIGFRRFFRSPTTGAFVAHFAECSTLYGKGAVGKEFSLVMGDIDCHKGGSYDGAMEFASYMRKFFPKAFVERSTNGNGIHFYCKLYTRNLSAQSVKKLYNRFSNIFTTAARIWSIDNPGKITGAEATGHPDIKTWKDGKLHAIASGKWMKIPRECEWRVEEFKNIESVSIQRIIEIENHFGQIQESDQNPTEQSKVNHSDKVNRSYQVNGSFTGTPVKNLDTFREVSLKFPERLATNKREIVVQEDWAIFLAILWSFRNSPTADGSCPMKRIRQNWEILYRNGLTVRGWSHHRIKTMRDYLTSLGYITWEDCCFCPAYLMPNLRGIASRWKPNARLEAVVEGRDSVTPEITERDLSGNKHTHAHLLDRDILEFRPQIGVPRPQLVPDLWRRAA